MVKLETNTSYKPFTSGIRLFEIGLGVEGGCRFVEDLPKFIFFKWLLSTLIISLGRWLLYNSSSLLTGPSRIDCVIIFLILTKHIFTAVQILVILAVVRMSRRTPNYSFTIFLNFTAFKTLTLPGRWLNILCLSFAWGHINVSAKIRFCQDPAYLDSFPLIR